MARLIATAPADRFVIGVVEEAEKFVERLIAGQGGREQEGLEEPAHVGQVPLRRADVRHGLDQLVLGAERLREVEGPGPHGGVTPHHLGPRGRARVWPSGCACRRQRSSPFAGRHSGIKRGQRYRGLARSRQK